MREKKLRVEKNQASESNTSSKNANFGRGVDDTQDNIRAPHNKHVLGKRESGSSNRRDDKFTFNKDKTSTAGK